MDPTAKYKQQMQNIWVASSRRVKVLSFLFLFTFNPLIHCWLMVFIYGPAQAITFATEVPQERNLLYLMYNNMKQLMLRN